MMIFFLTCKYIKVSLYMYKKIQIKLLDKISRFLIPHPPDWYCPGFWSEFVFCASGPKSAPIRKGETTY